MHAAEELARDKSRVIKKIIRPGSIKPGAAEGVA
jgi:hypothetical protein